MSKYLYLLMMIFLLGLLSCENNKSFQVVLISGSNEYLSDISLSNYQSYLTEKFPAMQVTLLKADGVVNDVDENSNLSGLASLDNAQVILLFLDQTSIKGEQLERIKRYIDSGKSVVAIRSACHAFQNWPEFDKIVLGRHYLGHYPGNPEKSEAAESGKRNPVGQPEGPTQEDQIVHGSEIHPILSGISEFRSRYSLYRTEPAAGKVNILMMGKIPDQAQEPVVWTNEVKKSRVVYIGLGGLQDWENATFKRLVANSIFWAARKQALTPKMAVLQQRPKLSGEIILKLQSRKLSKTGGDKWIKYSLQKALSINETAIVICDMWDKHWCRGATNRCAQLAIKMNPVLKLARQKGIQIIHAPSSTMAFYDDWPQRRRMLLAPAAAKPKELVVQDAQLPIDDSDGGCDTDDKSYSAWTRQSPYIEIGPHDGISDSGDEIFNFFAEQGIKNMIIMGVHTNMCVLERSFGIKQMTKWGIQCVLVRDLTDAMYEEKDYPYVSHEKGVELVVQHIEKYWCPSMLSDDLMFALY